MTCCARAAEGSSSGPSPRIELRASGPMWIVLAVSPSLSSLPAEGQATDAAAPQATSTSATAAAASTSTPGAAGAPTVALDDLLRLPSGYQTGNSELGGASPSQWRQRFDSANLQILKLEAELKLAQKELELAVDESSQWQITAPGQPAGETGPVSFKLREDIRRIRADLTTTKRSQRQLVVEADLAGVPPEWRGTDAQ